MVEVRNSGDIFFCGAEAIVNPVNTVGVSGAGLALEFKKRYPDMFGEYSKLCKVRHIKTGKVWVWDNPGPGPLYIVNFPTKKHWRDSSQLSWIKDGLWDLRNHEVLNRIRVLALPALGCGLGGLNFDSVRQQVEDILGDLTISVVLFHPGTSVR